jgi:serine protease Do
MRSREFATFVTLFGAVALGFLLLGAPGLNAAAPAAAAQAPAAAVAAAPAVAGLPGFADLAEQVLPAVVSIEATRIQQVDSRSPGRRLDPFEFFFPGPRQREGEGEPSRPREFRNQSGGSGFVISAEGLVITNHHVVADATEVKVHLGDRDFKAEIRGMDEETDLAVLKIEVDEPLPFLPMGDSDLLRVGDWVMVIGNPLALGQTVTVGVVGAKGRTIGVNRDASFENFIQTDAAINRGNSGGPLVNLAGQVVGIATAMNWGAENIGFAVPVNTLRAILPQLRDQGRVSRGYLGINIQNLERERAPAFGLEEGGGALVVSVDPDTPAGKAGLRHGDVVLEVDGREVRETRDLIDYVSSRPPGEKVRLTVLRDGKRTGIDVTLGERPGLDGGAGRAEAPSEETGIEWLGLEYRDLSSMLRQGHGLPAGTQGILVTDVRASSPLVEEGLAPGDVVTEVNGQAVASVAEFERAVRALKRGEFLRLYVKRFSQRGDGREVSFFSVARVP